MKIGRNDPCPCGAVDAQGKALKYKKCCLLKDEELEQLEKLEWEQWFAQDLAIGQDNLASANAANSTNLIAE